MTLVDFMSDLSADEKIVQFCYLRDWQLYCHVRVERDVHVVAIWAGECGFELSLHKVNYD